MMSKTSALIERPLAAGAQELIRLASKAIVWPRWQKRLFVAAGDALLCVLASWLAFSLRLGEWRLLDWPVVRFTLSTLIVWFPVAWYYGIYNAIFRYAGRGAIVSLAAAIGFTTLPLIFFYTFRTYPGVPRTLAVLGPLFFFIMMTVARIVGRYILVDLFHSRPKNGVLRRVLIYGAGAVGQRLANSLSAEPGMQLVGFVDDDSAKRRQRLDGVRVHHTSEVGEVIARTGATDVLLAMSHVSFARRRAIVRELEPFAVNVQTLPPISEVIDGRIPIDALRPIEIEDLLGRTPVLPDEGLLHRSVSDKTVMITGAGGSIGSEISRQVVRLRARSVVLVEASEFALFEIGQQIDELLRLCPEDARPRVHLRLCNVADKAAVARLFDEFAPQTIFHAAAYKHVPLVEENALAGIHNNLFGTFALADAAIRAKVERFVLISTDKAVRPPNVMGASKRACELVLQAFADCQSETIFAMVRFGNVLGSSGSVVPLFKRQIAAGGPVTVTHREVTRYFMTIPEAAQLVIQAGGMAAGGEVFVLDMGEPVQIWHLARAMIHLGGLSIREPGHEDGDIEIVESGLRPGEKLFEELLIGDDPSPTAHPRILRARETFVPLEQLRQHLTALSESIERGDIIRCRAELKKLVPSLVAEPAVGPEAPKAPPQRQSRVHGGGKVIQGRFS